MAQSSKQSRDPAVERIRQYLHRRVEDGDVYFKSKYIANDLEFSPHQIGALFRKLSEAPTQLEIEQWATSNGTTWRVCKVQRDRQGADSND